MIKIIRKNQRVVMVVLGVVLMVMFLSNMGPQGSQQASPVLRTVAHIGNVKVTQLQLNTAAEEWQMLKSLEYVDPNRPSAEPMPLVTVVLGRELPVLIEQSQKSSQTPPLFFLLLEEANRQSIFVNPEQVQTIVASNVLPQTQIGTEEHDRIAQAVEDCLRISKLASRASSVIKISKPYQDFTLANMAQNLSVNAVTLRASSLLKDIAEPTDAEIKSQFDKYSDRVAAVSDRIPTEFGQTDDPLGFGYKIPNRVTLQYIGLSLPDLAKAAMGSKSNEDWYVAAFGDFKANREDYDSQPVATTQQSASTQPSSGAKKLDNLEDDFTLHVPLVLKKLYEQQTRTLEQDVVREINEKLSAGFGTYRDAIASSSSKGATGSAADYISFTFMHNLADSVRTKFGVTPILGNIQQYKNESELGELHGIGTSTVAGTNGQVTFPVYAARLFQPWLTDAEKNTQKGALAIAAWQPSNPLEDAAHNLYVFRISGSEAEHVPAMNDVKSQVVADCKIAAAYAKCQQAGSALLASANDAGLTAAAEKAKLGAPILTDAFSPESIVSGQSPAVISPLILSSDSAREFADVSQKLLITPPAHDNRLQLLANLYADRVVAVIELHEARPSWDLQTKPYFTSEFVNLLQREQSIPLEMSLFKPEAVASRVGYKPEPR